MTNPYGPSGPSNQENLGRGSGQSRLGGGLMPGGGQVSGGERGRVARTQNEAPRPRSSRLIVGSIIGVLVVALLGIGSFAFLRHGASGLNPPTPNPTASTTATTGAPKPRATGNGEQYSADFLGGKFHIESTSIVQGPKDEDGVDTILVTYRIVNNTSKTQVVGMCVPHLEQKGSRFPRATFKTGEEPEGYDYNSPDEIKPGETLTVMGAYKYLYVGEPVTFRTWAHITEEDASDDPWGVGQEDGKENDTLWVWQPY